MDLFHHFFIADIKRRLFEENQLRIHKCLDLIHEDQLWFRHNENVNSIGNLILHLCGNITQYVCSGLFREKDARNRPAEFSASQSHTISEIRNHLDDTMAMISTYIDKVTPEMLTEDIQVQGFSENGMAVLIHITEHFSYHVGQITYITKLLNNIDTGYYSGLDLNAKSS